MSAVVFFTPSLGGEELEFPGEGPGLNLGEEENQLTFNQELFTQGTIK